MRACVSRCVGWVISAWVRVRDRVSVRARVTVRVRVGVRAARTCACRACAGLCSNGDKDTSPV